MTTRPPAKDGPTHPATGRDVPTSPMDTPPAAALTHEDPSRLDAYRRRVHALEELLDVEMAECAEGVEIIRLALTALKRSSPADPGHGEREYREQIHKRGMAFVDRVTS